MCVVSDEESNVVLFFDSNLNIDVVLVKWKSVLNLKLNFLYIFVFLIIEFLDFGFKGKKFFFFCVLKKNFRYWIILINFFIIRKDLKEFFIIIVLYF